MSVDIYEKNVSSYISSFSLNYTLTIGKNLSKLRNTSLIPLNTAIFVNSTPTCIQ